MSLVAVIVAVAAIVFLFIGGTGYADEYDNILKNVEHGIDTEIPQDGAEVEIVSETAPVYMCEYIALSFTGYHNDPQRSAASFAVWDDLDFVAKVWNSVGYDDWVEFEACSVSGHLILLLFHSDDGDPIYLVITEDDIGWRKHFSPYGYVLETITGYYAVPPGTFDRVSKLLTDYITDHSNLAIDIGTVRNFSPNGGAVRFSFCDEPLYVYMLPTEEAGDFVAEWELESWQPLSTDEMSEEAYWIGGVLMSGRVGIDVKVIEFSTIGDIHMAQVRNGYMFVSYRVPVSVYQTIEQQFKDFRAVSATLVRP